MNMFGYASWKLALAWLIAETSTIYGWVAPSYQAKRHMLSKSWKRHYHGMLFANLDSFENDNASSDEDDECYDLCEDNMPVFFEDDEPAETADISDETARNRLEMKWGLDENEEACDLEQITTCGEMCQECQGQGVVACRFCGGSTALLIGNNAISCPVCTTSRGVETCKSCRGSGYIAQWTLTGNGSI